MKLLRRRPATLSVVFPCYNVEPYVAASLDSVLAQPVANLEVIAVNDGSTDDTASILQTYAERHTNVTVVAQDNGGLSAARNTGLRHCTGDYVAFVDSDDILPPDAWTPMLKGLRRTKSPLAIGMAERVFPDGTHQRPPLLARNHAESRAAITLEDAPLMIADVFAWNKVLRLDFWRQHDFTFPEDIRHYEDQVLFTEVFVAASQFDVHTEVAYHWYAREDQSSLSQTRTSLLNLRERLETKQRALATVLSRESDALTDVFYRQVLPIDMWEHFRAAISPQVESPDVYWDELRSDMLGLWNDGTVPFEQTQVPPGQRLMGWLVTHDRRDDLARLIHEIDTVGVPTADGRYLHPWRDDPGVPDELGLA